MLFRVQQAKCQKDTDLSMLMQMTAEMAATIDIKKIRSTGIRDVLSQMAIF